jgi:hypothetical protein
MKLTQVAYSNHSPVPILLWIYSASSVGAFDYPKRHQVLLQEGHLLD